MYATRGRYFYDESTQKFERQSGHAILIVGYVIENGYLKLIINDPAPVNIGSYKLFSYEKMVDGYNTVDGELSDSYYWDGCVPVYSEYTSQTINSYIYELNHWIFQHLWMETILWKKQSYFF